jgi:salicylate 5-hydroxylase large subunit
MDIVPEAWWGGPTAVMTTLFPSVILQQQVNSVSTRHIQPTATAASTSSGRTSASRTTRGDDAAPPAPGQPVRPGRLRVGRRRRGDRVQPAGFESKPVHRAVAELGGREVGDTEHMVTETLIRGMYRYWRDVMES